MARLDPLPIDALPDDLKAAAKKRIEQSGFVPNSILAMARRPDIVRAYQSVRTALHTNPTVPPYLRLMMFHIMSLSSGCLYCQAHSATFLGELAGEVPEDKIDALWDYETSPHFTDAERVALRFAQAAGCVPNAVTDEDFAALRRHYSEEQIVEMVAGLAYGAFLNKINDTLATQLEPDALDYASRTLGPRGWAAGKHAAE